MQLKKSKLKVISTYIKEVVEELFEKVTWPTWAELQNSAFVVLIASVIVALLVWLMDFLVGIQSVNLFGFTWKGFLGFIYELLKSFR